MPNMQELIKQILSLRKAVGLLPNNHDPEEEIERQIRKEILPEFPSLNIKEANRAMKSVFPDYQPLPEEGEGAQFEWETRRGWSIEAAEEILSAVRKITRPPLNDVFGDDDMARYLEAFMRTDEERRHYEEVYQQTLPAWYESRDMNVETAEVALSIQEKRKELGRIWADNLKRAAEQSDYFLRDPVLDQQLKDHYSEHALACLLIQNGAAKLEEYGRGDDGNISQDVQERIDELRELEPLAQKADLRIFRMADRNYAVMDLEQLDRLPIQTLQRLHSQVGDAERRQGLHDAADLAGAAGVKPTDAHFQAVRDALRGTVGHIEKMAENQRRSVETLISRHFGCRDPQQLWEDYEALDNDGKSLTPEAFWKALSGGEVVYMVSRTDAAKPVEPISVGAGGSFHEVFFGREIASVRRDAPPEVPPLGPLDTFINWLSEFFLNEPSDAKMAYDRQVAARARTLRNNEQLRRAAENKPLPTLQVMLTRRKQRAATAKGLVEDMRELKNRELKRGDPDTYRLLTRALARVCTEAGSELGPGVTAFLHLGQADFLDAHQNLFSDEADGLVIREMLDSLVLSSPDTLWGLQKGDPQRCKRTLLELAQKAEALGYFPAPDQPKREADPMYLKAYYTETVPGMTQRTCLAAVKKLLETLGNDYQAFKTVARLLASEPGNTELKIRLLSQSPAMLRKLADTWEEYCGSLKDPQDASMEGLFQYVDEAAKGALNELEMDDPDESWFLEEDDWDELSVRERMNVFDRHSLLYEPFLEQLDKLYQKTGDKKIDGFIETMSLDTMREMAQKVVGDPALTLRELVTAQVYPRKESEKQVEQEPEVKGVNKTWDEMNILERLSTFFTDSGKYASFLQCATDLIAYSYDEIAKNFLCTLSREKMTLLADAVVKHQDDTSQNYLEVKDWHKAGQKYMENILHKVGARRIYQEKLTELNKKWPGMSMSQRLDSFRSKDLRYRDFQTEFGKLYNQLQEHHEESFDNEMYTLMGKMSYEEMRKVADQLVKKPLTPLKQLMADEVWARQNALPSQGQPQNSNDDVIVPNT